LHWVGWLPGVEFKFNSLVVGSMVLEENSGLAHKLGC
jgi:hypothetical protein